MTPDGHLQEVKPGWPVIIQQPAQQQAAPPKSYMIKPDGSVEEVEPGKPIVIQQPAPLAPYQAPPYQIIGPDGKPVSMTKEQLDMQMRWWEFEHKVSREDATQKALIGVIDEVKKHAGTAIKAGDRAIRLREKRGPAQPATPQEQVVTLECDSCHEKSTVLLRAIRRAGNRFQCASCGEMNQVVFEGEETPAPPSEQ